MLGLFQLLGGDSNLASNCFLAIDDQHFSVSQIFKKVADVLFGLNLDLPLFYSGLLSQPFVFWLDEFESGLDYLGISLDVEGVDCPWKVLKLD